MQAWNFAGPVPEDIGVGYDLVLACNSLHASASIAEALSHAFSVLAPGGFLCIYEATGALPALLWGLAAAVLGRRRRARLRAVDYAAALGDAPRGGRLPKGGSSSPGLLQGRSGKSVAGQLWSWLTADSSSLVYSLSEPLAKRMQGLAAHGSASPLVCS